MLIPHIYYAEERQNTILKEIISFTEPRRYLYQNGMNEKIAATKQVKHRLSMTSTVLIDARRQSLDRRVNSTAVLITIAPIAT